MAGNLVKWWKHKILGGYKQFSVQECTTDSEELMYHQVRASSSCSAPPDLLLVSDRENNIPLRSPVVNIIAAATTTTAPATTTTSPSSGINACHITSASNNNQRHQQKLQQQHQLQQQSHHHHVTTQQLSLAYNGTKDIIVGNNSSSSGKHQKQTAVSGLASKHGQQQQQLSQTDCQQQTLQQHEVEGQLESQTNNHSSTRHAHHTQQHHHQQPSQQQRSDDHIRLEEFTCDVSVEGGKSSQPLQFSFTFYDLDGHHGKITKDDIVGIVYTIYESIGKSVVVPHSGSKTINVRLTVSPEGKSKANKNKKTSSAAAAVVLDSNQKSSSASQAARRLHRYRPRKLIKSDEEDDDSNSDKERDTTALNTSNLTHVLASKSNSKTHKLHKLKSSEHHCCSVTPNPNPDLTHNSPLETIYDNLKAATAVTTPEACRECLAAVDESRSAAISPIAQYHPAHVATAAANKITSSTTNEAYMKHVASTRIKMLRKSRKQKHQDCMETRQRSLSVGNETCWKNRHLQKQTPTSQQQQQQQLLWHAEQQLNNSAGGGGVGVGGATDMVDGVQLRNPLKGGIGGGGVGVGGKVSSSSAQKRNSAECWKTALNRNDLISIIRESMEKNRLCFQLNGKPQANVSPIRHSQPTQQTTQQQHHQQHLHHNQHNSSSNKHSQVTTPTNSQRQRSNTVSKIPTLIANHNSVHSTHSPAHHSHYTPNNSSSNNVQQRSSSCVNTISNSNNNNLLQQHSHDTSLPTETLNISSSNSSYHQHLQPHIPIYHQQMAINPAVIAAHNALLVGNNGGSGSAGHHGKMNLCGYDSFLHATICGGGLSHSPPAHTSLAAQITSPSNLASAISGGQQIATVQPIMSSTNSPSASKHLSLAVTANQIKTSKILRSGSYAQSQHHHHQQQHHSQSHSQTTQNSPQYHGYQRLPSSSKHNLSALHLVSPTMEKPHLDQLDKWRRDQVKNYDQLLYAKLSEKLQQTNLVSPHSANGREGNTRRKHRVLRQRRPSNLIAEANHVSLNSSIKSTKLCLREETDYASMLPLEADAVECENLLGQSSDEESHSQTESPVQCSEKLLKDNTCNRHVAEGTLVDLDDVEDEDEEQVLTQPSSIGNHPLNADTLLSVTDEVHQLHLDDALEIEEDLEEDLDDDLEEEVDVVEDVGGVGSGVTESGRQSAASNDSNNTGATLANTNGAANTSTTSSSLIHRYVHEHIHHHYHHFEEKEE